MSRDVEIDAILRVLGFDAPEACVRARAALEAAGLTRPGKLRIAEAKLPQAREALEAALFRVCASAECLALAGALHGFRVEVRVSDRACEVCAGSNNRRALRGLARALSAAGVLRLLVVGGTPGQHVEIQSLLAEHGVTARVVDGAVGTHSRRDAAPDMEWAQMMVVWGATPLPHKVSKLYTDDPPAHLRGRTVKLAKRGVEALCREVVRSLG